MQHDYKNLHLNRGAIKYKLVTQDYTSCRNTQWKSKRSGKWLKVKARGNGTKLCSSDVVHFYDHPLVAVFCNPLHSCVLTPRMLEIEIDKEVNHNGLKGGCKLAKAIREIPVPILTWEQYIKVPVLMAKKINSNAYITTYTIVCAAVVAPATGSAVYTVIYNAISAVTNMAASAIHDIDSLRRFRKDLINVLKSV